MKRLKSKALMLGGMLTISAVVLTAVAPPPLGSERFQKEKSDIQNDLANIAADRAEISFYKSKKKADKQADLKMAVIVDRKELKKAKADLKRDKAYLRADKKDVKQDYRLVIREEKAELRADRKELADAKHDLRVAVRKEDKAAVKTQAALVTSLMSQEEAGETALAALRDDRHEDLVAVNVAIAEVNGQSAITLAAENSGIAVREWAMN